MLSCDALHNLVVNSSSSFLYVLYVGGCVVVWLCGVLNRIVSFRAACCYVLLCMCVHVVRDYVAARFRRKNQSTIKITPAKVGRKRDFECFRNTTVAGDETKGCV